jgi:hypothetical protein
LECFKVCGTYRITHEAILKFINDGCGKKPNKAKSVVLKTRILINMRTRICKVIKGKVKSDTTKNLLGCSLDEFLIHIEKQFKPGMTFENYGCHGWHIDHIIPCATFDLSRPYHQKICFHYTNLRPMWEKENISKGKTVSRIDVAKYFINRHKLS